MKSRDYVGRVMLIVLALVAMAAFTHFVLGWSFLGVFAGGLVVLILDISRNCLGADAT
jgi:hypothetical protein